MKPRERRDRLFKKSRPHIREMNLVNQQGYTKDMAVLWGAYKQGSFDLPETSQEEFAQAMADSVSHYERKWIVEDTNNNFGEGYGPIGMICANYNGWELSPSLEMFSWSSPRNTLRAMISFLQMMRYDKSVGIVVINTLKDGRTSLNHAQKYGVLNYATKIPDGDERGDKYVYYIRGRK